MGQRSDLHFIVKLHFCTEGVADPYYVAGVKTCILSHTAPEWDMHSTILCTVGVTGHGYLDMYLCAMASHGSEEENQMPIGCGCRRPEVVFTHQRGRLLVEQDLCSIFSRETGLENGGGYSVRRQNRGIVCTVSGGKLYALPLLLEGHAYWLGR